MMKALKLTGQAGRCTSSCEQSLQLYSYSRRGGGADVGLWDTADAARDVRTAAAVWQVRAGPSSEQSVELACPDTSHVEQLESEIRKRGRRPMAESCFDSYDALVSNAEISGLESEQWLAVKGMDPWDPAAAREQCAQAVRRTSSRRFLLAQARI
jgi:hypothetical protein